MKGSDFFVLLCFLLCASASRREHPPSFCVSARVKVFLQSIYGPGNAILHQRRAIARAELNIIGVGLLASVADLHERSVKLSGGADSNRIITTKRIVAGMWVHDAGVSGLTVPPYASGVPRSLGSDR